MEQREHTFLGLRAWDFERWVWCIRVSRTARAERNLFPALNTAFASDESPVRSGLVHRSVGREGVGGG